MAVHGQPLAHLSTSPERLSAFNESFLMLAAICALANAGINISAPNVETCMTQTS